MNLCDPFDDSIPKFYELHIVLWKRTKEESKAAIEEFRVISAVEMVNIV